jgi:alkylated DNA repair dioxygenase AlkB
VARLPVTDRQPDGLVYRPDLLARDDEQSLLGVFEELSFDPIVIRGQAARRAGLHYGIGYDYEGRGREIEVGPMPEWLLPVREAAAALAGLPPDALVEGLLQRYPPGATIGWHRDAPMFGTVVGISLLSPCRMRFRRVAGGEPVVYEQILEACSGYVLAGSVRWAWQHSIPPTKELRYSITFRTLRGERDTPRERS